VGRGPGVNSQCLGITNAESCEGRVSSYSGSRERGRGTYLARLEISLKLSTT
jgi:hypothetical protein